MTHPSISVVIPLFNKQQYVSAAIDSVLSQTFQDFEIVVVNDGSTDDGPEVVRQKRDGRIRLIDQDNGGVSSARNRGIQAALSDVIAFLDADDEWRPEFLSIVMDLRARYPEAGAYATAYRISKGKGLYRDVVASAFARTGRAGLIEDYFGSAHKTLISSSSVAVLRKVFDRLDGFREGYTMGEDMDMWFRIAAHYDIAYSPTIAAVWQFGVGGSACQTKLPTSTGPRQDCPAKLRETGTYWAPSVPRGKC